MQLHCYCKNGPELQENSRFYDVFIIIITQKRIKIILYHSILQTFAVEILVAVYHLVNWNTCLRPPDLYSYYSILTICGFAYLQEGSEQYIIINFLEKYPILYLPSTASCNFLGHDPPSQPGSHCYTSNVLLSSSISHTTSQKKVTWRLQWRWKYNSFEERKTTMHKSWKSTCVCLLEPIIWVVLPCIKFPTFWSNVGKHLQDYMV